MKREQIKALIELSMTWQEADKIINDYTNFKTLKERIAYIQGMFDIEIFHKTKNDLHADYISLLNSIVNKKWE